MSVDPTFADADASSGSCGDAIVDVMLEVTAASKMRATAIMKNEDHFIVSKCIKVLDEMQALDQRIYFFALDLFENTNARETFIALKSEKRETWLQGKFNVLPPYLLLLVPPLILPTQ
ncbi:hypothetical protein U1Q18_022959, partial [Sarracenia purpurea var. burkii]